MIYTALVVESEEGLKRLAAEFGRVCKRRMLQVNELKMNISVSVECG